MNKKKFQELTATQDDLFNAVRFFMIAESENIKPLIDQMVEQNGGDKNIKYVYLAVWLIAMFQPNKQILDEFETIKTGRDFNQFVEVHCSLNAIVPLANVIKQTYKMWESFCAVGVAINYIGKGEWEDVVEEMEKELKKLSN